MVIDANSLKASFKLNSQTSSIDDIELQEVYSYGDGRLLDMTWQSNNLLLIASAKSLWHYNETGFNQIIDNPEWVTTNAVFSPDKRDVYVNENHEKIQVWNSADGTLMETLDYVEQTDFFAVDQDKQILLTGSGGGQIDLFSLETSLPIQSTQAGLIYGLELHPSGKYYAYFGTNTATIYNIDQHSVLNYEVATFITDMVFDPVQDALVIVDDDNNIHKIDAETGTSQRYSPPNFTIHNLSVTQNGTIVATSFEQNETLLIDNAFANETRFSVSGTNIDLNPNETKMAIAQLDGTIQIFDILGNTIVTEFGNFIYQIRDTAFHSEKSQIGISVWNRFSRYSDLQDFIVWDYLTDETYRIQEIGSPVNIVSHLTNADIWALGLINGEVSLYSESLEKIATFQAYDDNEIYKLAFHDASQTLFTLSSIGELKLWNISNLSNIKLIYQFEYRINDIAINPYNNHLVYSSGTSIVYWNLITQTQVSIFPTDIQQTIDDSSTPLWFWRVGIYALAIDENHIYSVSTDAMIPSRLQKWEINTQEVIASIDIEELQIQNLIMTENVLIGWGLGLPSNTLLVIDMSTMQLLSPPMSFAVSDLEYGANSELVAITGNGYLDLYAVIN